MAAIAAGTWPSRGKSNLLVHLLFFGARHSVRLQEHVPMSKKP